MSSAQPFRVLASGRHRGIAGVVVLMCLTLPACMSLAPKPSTPAPITQLPEAFSRSEIEAVYEPSHWWTSYNDAELNRLVDSALVGNLDLVEAVARLDEVRAQYRVARSALLPGVTASGSYSYIDSPRNTGTASFFSRLFADSAAAGGDTGGVSRFSTETYSASLGFSYELDFWGRVRNDRLAARRDWQAVLADVETARNGVIAEAIATYFELADLRARQTITTAIVDLLTERVQQAEERYTRGLTSSFELYQLRQDFRSTQAGLPRLATQITDAEGRLGVLLGRFAVPASEDAATGPLPEPSFDPIPTGLPSRLLFQRPDVLASALRFEAARHRVGARRAELLPGVSLTGSLGSQSSDVPGILEIFDQWATNLTAGITAPLFQGGRLRANVDAAEARHRQQAAVFARTVLTAFSEAETALRRYRDESTRYDFLRGQVEEARASADLLAERYQAGVAEYTEYLDALRSLLQARTALSGAHRDIALARLDVHRALGGSWAPDAPAPAMRMIEERTAAAAVRAATNHPTLEAN